MQYYIYILKCSNGSYYTGYTTDMVRRYQEHAMGSPKCKYTRSFPPVGIVACWEVAAELSLVLKIEAKIKTLSKEQKMVLINAPDSISHLIHSLGGGGVPEIRPFCWAG